MGSAVIGGCGLLALKPENAGASYANYFDQLNRELKLHGPYKPSLLVDLDKLDANIATLKKRLNPRASFRIVAKSLPSPELLGYIMKKAQTNRLMLFHQPFINHVASAFPYTDILLGKPMPVKAAALCYQKLSASPEFDPEQQLQWLIDSPERLAQYLDLARQQDLTLQINIELDVGLHRGGVKDTHTLDAMLSTIVKHPKQLHLSGFMGYNPHVVKIPGVLKSQASAYRESQAMYQEHIAFLKHNYPELYREDLCFNGAGSPTLGLHQETSVANDISAGSCLVKPKDFDIDSLQGFVPAAYIATPVLKKIMGTHIPAVEAASDLFALWDPNQTMTYFIYGGDWKAEFESPPGLQHNALYGNSTNQQIVNGAAETRLNVDDHVFLRPTQSEFVFLQFGDLLALRNGKIHASWPVLTQ